VSASQQLASPPPKRRSQYLSATALARVGNWGAWPAGLVCLPLALAPSVAGATTIPITTACTLTGSGVCDATTLLTSPGSNTDTIAFQGGALTLDGSGLTYAQKATLGTTPTNILNQDGHDTTFTSVFSGTGNIEIANTGSGGSVTFNAANTYSGTTTVDAGANLKLGATGKIASSSSLADNGTFDISGAGGNITIKDLSGSSGGAVLLGANNLILSAASSLFAGGISSTGGGLTVNGGTETLSGNNTYTGVTTIGASGTLSISGSGSIASSSKVTDNGTFDISKASGDVTITTLAGSGNVNLGGNSVLLSAATNTFSGVINGTTGGVTVQGGSETLSGVNTYGGTTTINPGATLVLTGAGAIQNSSVTDNGTFTISGTSGTSITSLAGSGTVNLGAQTLTLTSASGIFTGIINGNNAANGLTIQGGTETLNGTNTFKGITTVNFGATLTGTGSLAGTLANNGTVAPGSPGTFKVGGNYSQTGSLSIALAGTTTGTYGRLSVTGTVALGGSLDVDLVNGFVLPHGTTTYDILDYKVGSSNLTGDFSSVTFDGNPCTGGSDTWLCGGVTLMESFAVPGSLDLIATQTPEPGTIAVLATGLLGLLGLRRRRT
jgi:fibronectin-binding autotransporter adhesin